MHLKTNLKSLIFEGLKRLDTKIYLKLSMAILSDHIDF